MVFYRIYEHIFFELSDIRGRVHLLHQAECIQCLLWILLWVFYPEMIFYWLGSMSAILASCLLSPRIPLLLVYRITMYTCHFWALTSHVCGPDLISLFSVCFILFSVLILCLQEDFGFRRPEALAYVPAFTIPVQCLFHSFFLDWKIPIKSIIFHSFLHVIKNRVCVDFLLNRHGFLFQLLEPRLGPEVLPV